MILVDTNVWSEAFRRVPDERVRIWARANADASWLSTVVIGELLSGADLLPDGQRKSSLLASYDDLIAAHSDRIVGFDLEAARHYATVLAKRVRSGKKPGTADTQIAARALSLGMSLATRNVRHFEGLGVALIDPWSA